MDAKAKHVGLWVTPRKVELEITYNLSLSLSLSVFLSSHPHRQCVL